MRLGFADNGDVHIPSTLVVRFLVLHDWQSVDSTDLVTMDATPPDWLTKDEVFRPIFALLIGLAFSAIVLVVLGFIL